MNQLGGFSFEEQQLRAAYNARRLMPCPSVTTWERPSAPRDVRYVVKLNGVMRGEFYAETPDAAFAKARAWVAGLEDERAFVAERVAALPADRWSQPLPMLRPITVEVRMPSAPEFQQAAE